MQIFCYIEQKLTLFCNQQHLKMSKKQLDCTYEMQGDSRKCSSNSVLCCGADAVDLGSPDELTEIAEVDEGICTLAAGAQGQASPPTIVISNSGGGASVAKPTGKGLRRLTGRSSKDKEKEKDMDQLTRKQAAVRAMSENLELLSLKRLTLTASQSVPKSGSLSLSRTASAVFSRSFEQVSNVFSGGNQSSSRASSPTANHAPDGDEGVAYSEHLSPAHQHRQRSPTISIHVTSDL